MNTTTTDASPPVCGSRALTSLQQAFNSALTRQLPTADVSLLVAYSGGLDSHVLLWLAKLWAEARPSSHVRAIYIDHGLQKQSDRWGEHCAQVCSNLGIPLQVLAVQVETNGEQSPEEAARTARYLALQQAMQMGEFLVTGHHADDQAETLLLQLMRGAGVRGLSSMPECGEFGCGFHLRPLLNCPAETLVQAGAELDLRWIDDPSNSDQRYDRNLIRHSVMPLLKARWPSLALNLSRTAAHCHEAAEISAFAAESLLGQCKDQLQLSLGVFGGLPVLHRKNLLRHWIESQGYRPPSSAQLNRMLADLVDASSDSAGLVNFGDAQIRRYRNTLYLGLRGVLESVKDFEYRWSDTQSPLVIAETGRVLTRADITFRPGSVPTGSVIVQNRRGGERIQLAGRSHSKTIKALLQEKGCPPWERSRVPLVFVDGELAAIIDIGVSAAFSSRITTS